MDMAEGDIVHAAVGKFGLGDGVIGGVRTCAHLTVEDEDVSDAGPALGREAAQQGSAALFDKSRAVNAHAEGR